MTTPNEHHSCGCGHHADKPVNPDHAHVREEIKILPAEGSVDTTVAPTEGAACGCAEGQCNCGHHQTCDCAPGECHCGKGHGANDAAVTETHETHESSCCGGHGHGHHNGRENNADIDGAVHTVDGAETHVDGTRWNDGNVPAADGDATASGQGSAEKGNVN